MSRPKKSPVAVIAPPLQASCASGLYIAHNTKPLIGTWWSDCIGRRRRKRLSAVKMVLLQPDPFLNELTSMFEKSTEKGSVWVTFKRSSLKSKVQRNKMKTAGEEIEYRCLIRATFGNKTISTSVGPKEHQRFQSSYATVLKAHMTALKKRDRKEKKKAAEADKKGGVGVCPSIMTWNAALSGCLKIGRTDIIWKLYQEMIECGVVADVDVDTDGYLIQAFCDDNKVLKGYELLRVLVDGLVPGNAAFNKLISGFCKETPPHHDCKEQYCHVYDHDSWSLYNGWLGEARKLWAKILYKEMCGGGHKETRVGYNAMMTGLCLHGRTDEAYRLFEEMPQKGIVPDLMTYNTVIQGFCREGKIVESTNLLRELLTHDDIIIGLCDQGDAAGGFKWLIEMLKSKRKPKRETFERLVDCLSQRDRLVDSLLVLDFMFRTGYALEKGICWSLVNKLCGESNHFVETCLWEILEGK
ncbi:unnamed protein product [Prunus armeniaca]|uniref:Signal recognition particle 14 kDa protein n=1 Tax=Prunus armeniaca TaxID=36596 RepID=A0A6J5TX54_PRUAR|nr:unnamed protein product [Prunus armeniaca]